MLLNGSVFNASNYQFKDQSFYREVVQVCSLQRTFGHYYRGGGATIEGARDRKIPLWSVIETETNQQVRFRTNFRSAQNLPIFQVYKTHRFSNLRSEIKAQCRPAEPGLAVRIIGLEVENPSVESRPQEVEGGAKIWHQSFKYGPISA